MKQIRILDSPEPLSEGSRYQECILVESTASQLLMQELRLYCQGWSNGRSFLVAGHRGAGKTTLVQQAFLRVREESRNYSYWLRPLLVPLHGPNLLPRPEDIPVKATESPKEVRPSETQIALEQITFGIYQALAKEISYQFWEYANGSRSPERIELAAQLETELYECPDAARLRDIWRWAGCLENGVLFRERSYPSGYQGLRELVALASAGEAYRRISGTYTRTDTQKESGEDNQKISMSLDNSGKDLFGPVASLLIGGLVGIGALATGHTQALGATAAGIASALGASTVFKSSVSRSRDRSVSRNSTFLFDTSVATLDRLLPCLIERIHGAGLAPVFVVDELDKVDGLKTRMAGLVQHLKKFVSENAFFCFLTDRFYYEAWKQDGDGAAYPPAYTYFTHQLYVLFSARHLHEYLKRVLQPPEAEPIPAPQPDKAAEAPDRAQQILDASQRESLISEPATDYPLLPYVLLHRSRMHPIDLRRELVNLRGKDGELSLRPGQVRSAPSFQVDLIMQIAIEIVLDEKGLVEELECHPTFRRLAHDALYYLSRKWLQPERKLDLGDKAGLQEFRTHLADRMGQEVGAPADAKPFELPDDRVELLYGKVKRLAELVSDVGGVYADAYRKWKEERQTKEGIKLDGALDDALDLEKKSDREPLSLLKKTGATAYSWRVNASGLPINGTAAPGDKATPSDQDILRDIHLIEALSLAVQEFGREAPGSTEESRVNLTTLSSQLRILSTKPAWPEAQLAMGNLKQAQGEKKPLSSLVGEVNCVRAYAEMLRGSHERIAWALFVGTALGRACKRDHSGETLLLGLLPVSRAYRFADRSEQEVSRDLQSLVESLRQELRLPDLKGKIPPLTDKASVSAWTARVRQMTGQIEGIDVFGPKPLEKRRRSAWEGWRERLQKTPVAPGLPFSGPPFVPSLDDLFCMVVDVSPANLLSPQVGEMGIVSWSEALFRSLADAEEQHPLYAPFWLVRPALQALGFSPASWQPMIEALRSGKGYSARQTAAEVPLLDQWTQGSSRPGMESLASLLILYKPQGSGVAGWKTSDRGAAVALSTDMAGRLKSRWPPPFSTLDVFVPFDRIAVEAEDPKPAGPFQRAVDKMAQRRGQAALPPLGFRAETPSSVADKTVPSSSARSPVPLVRNLDELIALHQANQQRPSPPS